MKLLSPAQQNQIFHYFAEGARAQEKERQQARRISSHHIYRVSLKSVAEYFGVQPNTLRNNVRASDQYKHFSKTHLKMRVMRLPMSWSVSRRSKVLKSLKSNLLKSLRATEQSAMARPAMIIRFQRWANDPRRSGMKYSAHPPRICLMPDETVYILLAQNIEKVSSEIDLAHS